VLMTGLLQVYRKRQLRRQGESILLVI